MSILDLQDVAEKRVARCRLQEVVSGFGVAFAGKTCLELLLGAELFYALSDLIG